jgi:hypothetical protein
VSVVNQSISRDQSEGSQPDLPRAPINHTVINPCGSDSICHVTGFFLAGAIAGIRSGRHGGTNQDASSKKEKKNQDAIGAARVVPTNLTGDSGARLPGWRFAS